MKNISSALILALTAANAWAALDGDGYYRVQNYMSSRYVYVTDNTGSLNYQTSTADMAAIQLWKDFEKASCDPATVLYIMAVGSQYDIQAQGTGIYEIIGAYVNLRSYGSYGTYLAYATSDGITKYLSDGEQADVDQGGLSSEGSGEWRYWYITPIESDGDNYFGVSATEVEIDGTYYQPFFAEFPFSTASSGMSVYYINKVENGMAVLSEITGTVPGATPVFIKTSSASITANLLDIGGTASSTVTDNLLTGVYFNNSSKKHNNQVAYDSSTMRMLGTTSDGSLGYITPTDLDYIPANYSYLSVSSGEESELKVVTEEEYEAYLLTIPTSITLSNSSITIIEGNTATLTATILPTTATQTVTWTSSDESVATVSSEGVVTAVAAGSATITAETTNGLTATCAVTVKVQEATSVTLNKTATTIYVGDTETLTATVLPENTADKSVTWTTSSPLVASVTSDGEVSGIKAGTAVITVTTANGLTATCDVTVSNVEATSITLSATELTLTEEETAQLTATVNPDNTTDKTVTWSSSDASVATVTSKGLVTAVKAGTATITVTATNGVYASCALTVNEIYATSITLDTTQLTLVEEDVAQLTATVLPANTSNPAVTWTSSDDAVATVDTTGLVTAVKAGSATITAATTNGLTATCSVTVEIPVATSITLSPTEVVINEGDTAQIVATVLPNNAVDKTVTWESSDTAIVTVDDNGTLVGIDAGQATITATTVTGLTATCLVYVNDTTVYADSVYLNLNEITVAIGLTEQLVATVLPENTNDKSLTWTSSDTAVATVDPSGLVTAIATGATTITVTTANGHSDTCQVTVIEIFATSVELDITAMTLNPGDIQQLTATIYPDDATYQDLVWQSSDTTVATVDQAGLVTASWLGEAVITVTTVYGLTATCQVTVSPVYVTSIELNKTQISLYVGETEQLTATVYPEDATIKTLYWQSSDTTVATVDQTGLVTVTGDGNATVTVTTTDGSDLSASCYVYGVVGVAALRSDRVSRVDIYTLSGILLKIDASDDDIRSLPPGVYIIGSQKVIKTQ